jgi:predicted nuclease with TOPRIM domain
VARAGSLTNWERAERGRSARHGQNYYGNLQSKINRIEGALKLIRKENARLQEKLDEKELRVFELEKIVEGDNAHGEQGDEELEDVGIRKPSSPKNHEENGTHGSQSNVKEGRVAQETQEKRLDTELKNGKAKNS